MIKYEKALAETRGLFAFYQHCCCRPREGGDPVITAQSVDVERRANLHRHARACRGHPRVTTKVIKRQSKAWMAGTSPAMTTVASVQMELF